MGVGSGTQVSVSNKTPFPQKRGRECADIKGKFKVCWGRLIEPKEGCGHAGPGLKQAEKEPRMRQDGCVESNQAKIGAADVLGWPGWAQSSRKWGRGCARMGPSSTKPKMGQWMCWYGWVKLQQAKNGVADMQGWLGRVQSSQKWGR